MIFDIVRKSLKSSPVLIPIEELLGNATGSRMPEVQSTLLTQSIAEKVVEVCPTAALTIEKSESGTVLALDYGECIGCGRCFPVSEGAVVAANSVSCCGASRAGLVRRWNVERGEELIANEAVLDEAAKSIRALVGRALNVRQLDAGSCNGCEAEIVALTNPYYDLERFGIHFVASPKHADMLLVTGPVTRTMAEAVRRTYAATPSPKLVVAVGACGIGGGIFSGSYAVVGSVDSVIPVDGYIPGCPPTPAMLVTGILRVLQHHKSVAISG
jgi:Ni,Fe-hydrogenase III small subunit/NAD-dependent dihydropyrimidine dehydrogenase PreA subunit